MEADMPASPEATEASRCCTVSSGRSKTREHCPTCGRPGRLVEPITVKAMLRPGALARLSDPEHRFCGTPGCHVVYFGTEEVFPREDVVVPVFQKEPAGGRTVCYCFGVDEDEIQRECFAEHGPTASERIGALVKAGRCACEVKNPQGSCCLGNVAAVAKAAEAAAVPR
jgi:hypothetical protein